MYCLFNGEYGEHDLSYVGGLEKTLEIQKEAYERLKGVVVGDFTILSVEYDWGKRSKRAEIECNYCHEKKYLYNVTDWIRGKGRSTKCECRKIAEKQKRKEQTEIEKREKAEKKTLIQNDILSWIGKEINGWKIIKYDYDYTVECVECGKRTHIKISEVKSGNIEKVCNHIIPNNYFDEKWIGQRNGHLTALVHLGKYFEAECDCGNKIKVRGAELFRYKNATTCKDLNCPYYQQVQAHMDSSRRRKDGFDYENKIVEEFKSQGYNVEHTREIADFGVDFIINILLTNTAKERIAVQVKKNKSPTGVSAIQEVYAGGRYYDCNRFAVISDAVGIEDTKDPACKGMVASGNPRTIAMLCEYGKYGDKSFDGDISGKCKCRGP